MTIWYQTVILDKRNYIITYKNIDKLDQLFLYLTEELKKIDVHKVEITKMEI